VGVQVPPAAPFNFILIMLENIVKYLKRTRTASDFRVLFDKCFLSKKDNNVANYSIIKNIFMYPIYFVRLLILSAKSLLFVPDFIIDKNGVAEYSVYKQYSRYKFIVFLALLLICLSFGLRHKTNVVSIMNHDYIARISIVGVIDDSEYGYGGIKFYEQVIKKTIENPNVKGVIIYINSGGGGVTASEILYSNLSKLSAAKLTICDVGSVSASGSYMAELACKKIYAKQTSIIGSIGVRSDRYEIAELAKKLGIKFNIITAGKLKAAGHPWKTITNEEQEYFNQLLHKMHLFFINLIAKERNLSVEDVTKVADGSIMMGSEAKKAGLIDEIGDVEDIIAMLNVEHGFNKDIKIVDILPPEPEELFAGKVRKFAGFAIDSIFDSINNKISVENNIKY
jgi:protease-4